MNYDGECDETSGMINLQVISGETMSTATKRKHVTKEVQDDIRLPTDSQSITQLVDSRGNNLHEVVDSRGDKYLVTMPVKFRRNIWAKRGDFVLVEPIAEGDKVKAEIVKILTKDHIKFFRSQGCWPEKFEGEDRKAAAVTPKEEEENESTGDDDDDDLFVNTNGRPSHLDGFGDESPSPESSDSE